MSQRGPACGRLFAAAIISSTTFASPTHAVIILDSTWETSGGAPGAEGEGFGASIALAEKPQFAAVLGFEWQDDYGGSGTWIGNDEHGRAYVLTAAHNFDDGSGARGWTYVAGRGTRLEGYALAIHPLYDKEDDNTGGYDMAIVVLADPVEDSGPPPLLYDGAEELHKIATMVGYGSRGTGSAGQAPRFYASRDKAAARNVIDVVEAPVANGRGGNSLGTDFDSEDTTKNALDGDRKPVDQYKGALGSGDSGGSLWINTAYGWAIAGINVSGSDDQYGATNWFSRVSTQRTWILSIFPGATFTSDKARLACRRLNGISRLCAAPAQPH